MTKGKAHATGGGRYGANYTIFTCFHHPDLTETSPIHASDLPWW